MAEPDSREVKPLNIWQRDLLAEIRKAAPEVPEDVARAAVSWVHSRELCRKYGPALIIAYSLKHAHREAEQGLLARLEAELDSCEAAADSDSPFDEGMQAVVYEIRKVLAGGGPPGQNTGLRVAIEREIAKSDQASDTALEARVGDYYDGRAGAARDLLKLLGVAPGQETQDG